MKIKTIIIKKFLYAGKKKDDLNILLKFKLEEVKKEKVFW